MSDDLRVQQSKVAAALDALAGRASKALLGAAKLADDVADAPVSGYEQARRRIAEMRQLRQASETDLREIHLIDDVVQDDWSKQARVAGDALMRIQNALHDGGVAATMESFRANIDADVDES